MKTSAKNFSKTCRGQIQALRCKEKSLLSKEIPPSSCLPSNAKIFSFAVVLSLQFTNQGQHNLLCAIVLKRYTFDKTYRKKKLKKQIKENKFYKKLDFLSKNCNAKTCIL